MQTNLTAVPVSESTQKWISLLDEANDLRTMFIDIASGASKIPDVQEEVLASLDAAISVLKEHYLYYAFMSDVEEAMNGEGGAR